MESLVENKTEENSPATRVSSTSSAQLYVSENLDLPDDTFRMSLDSFTTVGENVTICGREISTDSSIALDTPLVSKIFETTLTPQNTPVDITPTTPKVGEDFKLVAKRQNFLKLALNKSSEDDLNFVKPSPVADLMSPAKMLQFDVDISSTPTMKRAVVDFDFFSKNNFEEYFKDVKDDQVEVDADEEKGFKEIPVIVKSDTVTHEIEYDPGVRQRIKKCNTIVSDYLL